MFNRALQQRDAVKMALLQAFPEVRCFVRIAPAGSRWLLVSDAPRLVSIAALREVVEVRGLPYVIESDLLYLDATDAAYREAMNTQIALQRGPYQMDYALPQATAALLLQYPASHTNLARAKPLVREGWRAVALGKTQVLQWIADMQGEVAEALRKRELSGLFACGTLLAAWLAEREVAIPAEIRR